MSVRTQWMRPYKPAVEGTLANGLISYRKRPHTLRQRPTTMNLKGRVEVVTQYEYYLYLDLWIVKLQFNWLGKEILHK